MNTLPAVFNSNDKQHPQFRPILNHVSTRKSKITIGGSKYMDELAKMPTLARLIAEMRRSKKVVIADGDAVDRLEKAIAEKYPDNKYPDFNDKHIVALAYSANAKLVCTIDKPLQRYLRQRDFYNEGKTRPIIYNDISRPSVIPSGKFKPACRLCS